MIRLDAVRERLSDRVPALERLGNAADFGALVDQDRLPQVTPAAFVLFAGLMGGKADVISGMFRQSFTEGVSVVLMDRFYGEPLGDQALQDNTPLVTNVVMALAGWAPEDAVGVFVLGRAELVGAKNGMLVFQIDFQLNDQLRIST